MKLMFSLLAAGLAVSPAVAQPILVPLTPQKQQQPPPPPAPSPVPVAPPQAGGSGEAQSAGSTDASQKDGSAGEQGSDTQRAPER